MVTSALTQFHSYSEEDSLNFKKQAKNWFFSCLHHFNHSPFLFSFLPLVLQFSVSRQVSCVLNFESNTYFKAFIVVFATILVCINGAILEPEAIVFTTPKLKQYHLRKFSLCLLIPDPIPEHTTPSVVSVLLFMGLAIWTDLDFQYLRGGVEWLLNMLHSFSTQTVLEHTCRNSIPYRHGQEWDFLNQQYDFQMFCTVKSLNCIFSGVSTAAWCSFTKWN